MHFCEVGLRDGDDDGDGGNEHDGSSPHGFASSEAVLCSRALNLKSGSPNTIGTTTVISRSTSKRMNASMRDHPSVVAPHELLILIVSTLPSAGLCRLNHDRRRQRRIECATIETFDSDEFRVANRRIPSTCSTRSLLWDQGRDRSTQIRQALGLGL